MLRALRVLRVLSWVKCDPSGAHGGERAHWNHRPVRAVTELVAQLIKGLVDLKHSEQRLHIAPRLVEVTGTRHFIVDADETLTHAALPLLEETLPLGGILQALWRAALKGCAPRVREGAQHAGNIAQRQLLGATLGESARGLAFEIDDQEVVADQEHLPEMIIAMHAGLARAARHVRAERCESLQ